MFDFHFCNLKILEKENMDKFQFLTKLVWITNPLAPIATASFFVIAMTGLPTDCFSSFAMTKKI